MCKIAIPLKGATLYSHHSTTSQERFHPVIAMLKTALWFSLIALLILNLTRLDILAFILDHQIIKPDELPPVLILGLRFDLKLIATLLILFMCLPAFVFALLDRWILYAWWLRVSLWLCLVMILVLSFMDFGFYLYFGSSIDSLVFGIFDDGTQEVMASILSDARLLKIILAFSASLIVLSYLYIRSLRPISFNSRSSSGRWRNTAYLFLLTLFMILPARGSFDTFPLSRLNVNVSNNPLINSLALNAPFHFYYTVIDRSEDSFDNLTAEMVLQQADVGSANELYQKAGYADRDDLFHTSSQKPADFHPPHVIFVLMEGWSSHVVLMQAKDNDVLGAFAKHAKEDYLYPYFFSNAYGTNPTIDSLLMNSPFTPLSQSKAVGHQFDLSNLWPFKKQGYETLYLSGSTSGWRNHNNFWPQQGFDRYFGRATIEKELGVSSDNPWGVYEQDLFAYMKKMLLAAEDEGKPLFTFLMTTNNHPPIRLPADFKPPVINLRRFGFDESEDEKRKILNAFHYEADALGRFLDWLKQSPLKDKVIVVATGDHIYKGLTNYTSNEMGYLRYSVPAYFYVPKAYDQLSHINRNVVGSHEDLFPTLYELALSSEPYRAFGTPFMFKQRNTAFGWNERGSYLFDKGVVSQDGFYPWDEDSRLYLEPQPYPVAPWQQKRISQQVYRNWLKRYLLVRELNLTH